MFCVMTAFSFPCRSHSASFRCAALGFGAGQAELFVVESVILLRQRSKKEVAQNLLRRIGVFLVVQAVDAAEVRHAALRGDAGPAEKTMLSLPSTSSFSLRIFSSMLSPSRKSVWQSLPSSYPDPIILYRPAHFKRRRARRPADDEGSPPCREPPSSARFRQTPDYGL
jgi:hypothetical protein